MGTVVTVGLGSSASSSSMVGKRWASQSASQSRYSRVSQKPSKRLSHVNTTMRRRATRSIWATPARQSGQWCRLSVAIAASTVSSASGSASAAPTITGALPGGRWAIIACEGSMAITHRSGRFVRARPRPDVDDGAGITETGADGGGQARVWPAVPAVAGADAVVDRRVRAAGRRGIRVAQHVLEVVFAAVGDAGVEVALGDREVAHFGRGGAEVRVRPGSLLLEAPIERELEAALKFRPPAGHAPKQL